ncbi:hypothetical protein SAMN05421847_2145 [Halpernia humi]|uniref:Uncharacterized protein n=1 Tax=Halpernia humi TaxID=493375 RepID=A0A1H5ZS89_9FLAO|nr:hypothetical protein SAMN05421847_2145 [Halpernia humi]
MVQNGDIFTFRFTLSDDVKTSESTINIGFFGFFVYILSLTFSLGGHKFKEFEKGKYETYSFIISIIIYLLIFSNVKNCKG